MPTQETIDSLFAGIIENTTLSGGCTTPISTTSSPYGLIKSPPKYEETIFLNRIIFGIDKKATHKWNK